ncbi:MAG: hypothetical protein NZM31_15650 [Gemmatales bacterium]|nr:hypothetical protein [Gemmatales bacterium]MDW8388432.1 DUF6798 domain-containing protein [Gemmatales bacterium]
MQSKRGRYILVALGFLVATLLFATAYGQAPLFYSNQNQYLLHGLAQAGYGHLAQDWLANTADPTPIFSALVEWTCRLLPLETLHLGYAIVQGIYVLSLWGIFRGLVEPRLSWRLDCVFVALVIVIHAAVWRWLSFRFLDWDYPYYMQGGLAGQYILGPVFQPSVFGVLLLASIALFANNRPRGAAVVAGFGVVLHTTYLLSAWFLVAGFVAQLLRENRRRVAAEIVGILLVFTLPVIGFAWWQFGPTSASDFAEAQRILAHERIPHHCQARLWFDEIAALQLLWILGAIGLTWQTRLFTALAVASGLAALVSGIQILTDSDALALLFPWRLSAILMPAATAIYLAKAVYVLRHVLDTRLAVAWTGTAAALVAVAGLAILATGQGFQSSDEELPMMDWVRRHAQPGDVFLLPIRVPKLAATTRGSLSSDFKPLARKRSDAKIIPVDLQRFRLMTGAPIYVDFKSVPYKDTDVLEWRRRMDVNQRLLELLTTGPAENVAEEFRKAGITHVVLPTESPVVVTWPVLYRDAVYEVRKVPTGSEAH